QRGQGQRRAAAEGPVRTAQGRHRAGTPDVRGARAGRRPRRDQLLLRRARAHPRRRRRRRPRAHVAVAVSGERGLPGSRFVDRRSADAIPFLQHPDIRLTHLADYALFALGEAYANTRDFPRAAAAHLSVLEQYPTSPLHCAAMLDAAEAEAAYGRSEKGLALLDQALGECPDSLGSVLAAQGAMHQARKELKEAAAAYARLDRELPASPEAAAAATALRALKAYAPPSTPAERRAR